MKDEECTSMLKELDGLITRITRNPAIHGLTSALGEMNRTFQDFRKALHLPEKGNLSENAEDDESCGIFMG